MIVPRSSARHHHCIGILVELDALDHHALQPQQPLPWPSRTHAVSLRLRIRL
jgi:hypothetical protein